MTDDGQIPYRRFSFGELTETKEQKSAAKDNAEEPFKQIYGPRVAAVAERLRNERRSAEHGKKAEELAEELVAEARLEGERIKEQARREGFEKGLEEGREKLIRAADRLTRVAVDMASEKPRLVIEAREEVTRLALAIVERILGPLAAQNPEIILHVVEKALGALSERESITVRINPLDLQAVMEGKPAILSGVDGVRNLTFIDDHGVAQGGCIVETGSTEIDARLKTQLDEIVRALGF